MSTVIKVENLSKCYSIGAQSRQNYATFRDVIAEKTTQCAKGLVGLVRPNQRASLKSPHSKVEEFWALKDLSFEILDGEIVGVVGKNGAGKSTLLKILSRITAPTKGRVSVLGKIASLLEVGTGFHPELTGRENIFMNGAILGMSRAEIRRKFDQIVEFSEVSRFIDTPVKRYSSGMYMRLAFSVAAHLDPDILVVDEVLSVGDAAFQKKCIGAMQETTKQKRTVLFVSHNLPLIRTLCNRAILLDNGKISLQGGTEEVLSAFTKRLQSPTRLENENLRNRISRSGGKGEVRFNKVMAYDESGAERWIFKAGENIRLRVECQAFGPVENLGIYLAVKAAMTGEILTTVTGVLSQSKVETNARFSADISFPQIALRPGDYSLFLWLSDSGLSKGYDIIDHNVDLPLLSISSEEKDFHKREGFFSIPVMIHPQRIAPKDWV